MVCTYLLLYARRFVLACIVLGVFWRSPTPGHLVGVMVSCWNWLFGVDLVSAVIDTAVHVRCCMMMSRST